MFFTNKLLQTAIKAGEMKRAPNFAGSKQNLAVNALITSLYSFGALTLYKDRISIKNAKAKEELIPTHKTIAEIVRNSPNRIFKANKSEENAIEPIRIARTLTWSDLSQISIGTGFLIQLSNIIHSSFGKKSMFYKVSLLSNMIFPNILYASYRLRLKT